MHVVLRAVRRVVVDDDGDVPDVEAAGSHVRRDHDPSLAGLELRERRVALLLVEVAVELHGRHSGVFVAVQLPVQVAALLLGVAEDQAVAVLLQLSEDLLQQIHLLRILLDHLYVLRDVLVGGDVIGAHLDLHWPLDVALGEVLALLRPCGREHRRLALRGDPIHHLLDLGLEAHVEHPIGLVQHREPHLAQVDRAIVAEVVKAPGRRDEAVGALPQLPLLVALRGAAVGAGGRDLHRLAELRRVGVDLVAQLPRGRHGQQRRALARVDLLGLLQLTQLDEAWQQEGQGLARAGLGHADQVLARLQDGPRIRLDERRRAESAALAVSAGLEVRYQPAGEALHGLDLAPRRPGVRVIGLLPPLVPHPHLVGHGVPSPLFCARTAVRWGDRGGRPPPT
mmetsp:Transcript_46068/g.119158  ORF Transcript_46068/g.119158 Transcript_46068/m.119158 type:complete len:396 (+) Transcript_46068:224-1411(+)